MGFPETRGTQSSSFLFQRLRHQLRTQTSSDNSGLASNDEPDDLGEGLKPGDLHYRRMLDRQIVMTWLPQ